jgi:adenosylcobinamide kinase/adenosylcobinamide-phosphate guanylyltransferase
MRSRKKKTITLVLGGARSGKSRYAQTLALRRKKVTYIATARPRDPEMRRKIARHRRQRPTHWKTAEASRNLAEVIQREGKKADVLIIDCLTTFLANVANTRNGNAARLPTLAEEVCEAIRATKASVIAISNEVGSGVVPGYRSGRVYRDLLGQLNQQMAAVADRVVLMVAGIVLPIKDRRTKKS